MKLIAVFLYVFMISVRYITFSMAILISLVSWIILQSVIHPFVAQQLWSEVGILSVFKFCNGTVGMASRGRLSLHHTLTHNPSSMFVLDFAGSGIVHLLGGMGGLFLSLFDKIEEHLGNRYQKRKNKEKACIE
jgi:ammonia channel protein AmtB